MSVGHRASGIGHRGGGTRRATRTRNRAPRAALGDSPLPNRRSSGSQRDLASLPDARCQPSPAGGPGKGRFSRSEPHVTIRRATAADAEVVTELRLALLDAEWRPAASSRRRDTARRAHVLSAAQLDDEQQLVLLAVHRGRAIGVLRCTTRRGPLGSPSARVAFITTVYVRPSWRRRGVLRALLRTADRWARTRGLTEMQLLCAVDNAIGRAAWSALGFEPVEILHRRPIPHR